MKKISRLGLVLLCGLILVGCSNTNAGKLQKKVDKLEKNVDSLSKKINELEAVDTSSEKDAAKTKESKERQARLDKRDAEAEKLLADKIKVPETANKSQEQVESEFEVAGLKVKFVPTNLDKWAVSNKRKIYKGECDYVRDNSGAELFESDKVGIEKRGYYAKKGDTILVGYSDHDFDGTSSAEPEKTTPSSSSQEAAKDNNNAANKSDIEAAIKKVDAKYDDMIKKAQGYVDNPSSYKDSTSLEFLKDYTELMAEYSKLGETVNNVGDDFSASDSMKIYTNMLTKYTKLMELYSKLS
ncbi:hypothetical protein [Candidatus Enterococcus mansonii]|uniref:Lipoprotein n=1 Tax=Candidatus Enterococcus mansonii TaxID=1834181 RepID=A0A242C704_9ENTE|nr:hypothetical protein [Enterococcus sp. 4G2_DIV0659]OTO05690.1 hypothetical protein A5880_002865 [Enterococcus sp. 4G2_DIV0659]